jgi:hypothetical protein
MSDGGIAAESAQSGSFPLPSEAEATSMTIAAIILGLALTQDLNATDQNAVSNLLFAAAQAISTRSSLMPQE